MAETPTDVAATHNAQAASKDWNCVQNNSLRHADAKLICDWYLNVCTEVVQVLKYSVLIILDSLKAGSKQRSPI